MTRRTYLILKFGLPTLDFQIILLGFHRFISRLFFIVNKLIDESYIVERVLLGWIAR